MGDLIVMSIRLLITSNSHTLGINVNNCRCDRATLSPASWSPQSIGWHIGASSWPVHPEYCWSIVNWMVNQQFFGWSLWNDDHTYWWTISDRPTFLANANQTRVRVGVHLLALEYKHFSDSLWNRRKPIIWEIVEDSKKRRQMLTLRKVWPSREQVGREFTSSPQTFPFGNNCADDGDSDDFVM